MAGGNGSGRDDAFNAAVLRGLNAPVTAENLAVLRAWQRRESGTPQRYPDTASWNPFSTTLTPKNAKGVTSFNGIGVKNYTSMEQGVKATVDTLLKSNSAYGYDKIVNALQRSNPEAALKGIVASSWNAPAHYGANRTQGQGWNYKATSLYKDWKALTNSGPASSILGTGGSTNIGSTDARLPGQLVSGNGSAGIAYFDPGQMAIVFYAAGTGGGSADHPMNKTVGMLFSPWTNWLDSPVITAQQRRNTKFLVDINAVEKLGGALDTVADSANLDRGQVNEITPFTDTEGNPYFPQIADSLIGLGSVLDNTLGWFGENKTRIGLAVLGGFVVIIAVMFAARGKVMDTAKVVAGVMPQGKVIKAAAKVG